MTSLKTSLKNRLHILSNHFRDYSKRSSYLKEGNLCWSWRERTVPQCIQIWQNLSPCHSGPEVILKFRHFTSQLCRDGKKMYEQAWCMCRIVVLLITPVAFVTLPLPLPFVRSLIGWFSNRTGASVDDGAHKSNNWLTNGRAANWAPEVEFRPFCALTPSSNDVPVLLLNQPNDNMTCYCTESCLAGLRIAVVAGFFILRASALKQSSSWCEGRPFLFIY